MKYIMVLVAATILMAGCNHKKVTEGSSYVSSGFEGSWVGSSNSNYVNLIGDGTGTKIGGEGTVNGSQVKVNNGVVSGNSFTAGVVTGQLVTGGNLILTVNGSKTQMDKR